MKIAIGFARSRVHSSFRHHYLPPDSNWFILEPVVEPELKPDFDPAPERKCRPAVAVTVADVDAFGAVHRTAIV